MKINYNMSAYIANQQLLKNENKLTASLERLSSGYKINHAKDDAAGLAISTKMRRQLAGLERAEANANDGISVIETAEGALNEVTSMLQRMRELTVQASNGTYMEEDIEAIQLEIDQLKEEVDRIAKDTEFNKMPLLDGNLGRRVYADTREITRMEVTDSVPAGDYQFTCAQTAQPAKAEYTGDATAGVCPSGEFTINDERVTINYNAPKEEVYNAISAACTTRGITLTSDPDPYEFGGTLSFSTGTEGSDAKIEIKFENDPNGLSKYLFGVNADELTTTQGLDAGLHVKNEKLTAQTRVSVAGNTVTVTDRMGFEMTFDATNSLLASTGTNFIVSVTDMGTMTLQIGANENQEVEVNIPDMSTEGLRIENLDLTTDEGVRDAFLALDNALAKVSKVRSELGAQENRLNHAISSLEVTTENMTAAMSRIEDVDMAEEMSIYTQMNVLTQAATSVLAQANDLPQQVLQMLQ